MRSWPAAVLTVGLSAGLAAAQEPSAPAAEGASGRQPASEANAEEREPANELAVFLGGTSENDETHFTIGVEYARRLSERFALAVVGEHVSGTGAWVLMPHVVFQPVRQLGLALYAGPGVESKAPEDLEEGGRETFFVARVGLGWALELGRVSLTPEFELDFAREDGHWEKSIVFGVAIGVGF